MDKQQATFGSGCFWCTEAIFQNLRGVSGVISGYMGGHVKNPSYAEVCNGTTGHAEVIHFDYDAELVSFEELLLVFFKTHDPTTLNRQGNDKGSQYRSAVFYHTDEQQQQAEAIINQLDHDQVFDDPIVTEVVPATEFYVAENYHQNYYQQNQSQPYCTFVIQPKLNKFMKEYKEKLRS